MTGVETGCDPRLVSLRFWSRYCVVGLYVLAALWGSLQILLPYNDGVYYLIKILFAMHVTCWAVYDSKARGKTILHVLQMLYFLMWPIGATVYLIRTRGWRGIVIAVLHAMGLMLCMAVAFFATVYLLYNAGVLVVG